MPQVITTQAPRGTFEWWMAMVVAANRDGDRKGAVWACQWAYDVHNGLFTPEQSLTASRMD